MISFVFNYIYWILRPMLKWVIRKSTGKCELLRITLAEGQGYRRTSKTEESLRNSKSAELKQLVVVEKADIDDAVHTIMKIKSISPEVHPHFSPTIKICLLQIIGYRQLISEVDHIRKVQYSSENSEHEKLLMQLWRGLNPDTQLKSRLSKQWTSIGFQGEDPATDFRGMGILGLQNLIYLVSNYPDVARMLVSHANHPTLGYSFAIVGINLTGVAFDLLRKGFLKTHFYNAVQGRPTLENFNYVYCYLFYEFDKFWFAEKPPSIMEFNHYKDKFVKKMTNLLKNKNTVLRLNFSREYSNKVSSVQI